MLWQYYKCSIYHLLSCLTQPAQAESTLSREESVLYKVYLGPLSVVKFKCTSYMCMCIYYTPIRQIESPAHTCETCSSYPSMQCRKDYRMQPVPRGICNHESVVVWKPSDRIFKPILWWAHPHNNQHFLLFSHSCCGFNTLNITFLLDAPRC